MAIISASTDTLFICTRTAVSLTVGLELPKLLCCLGLLQLLAQCAISLPLQGLILHFQPGYLCFSLSQLLPSPTTLWRRWRRRRG